MTRPALERVVVGLSLVVALHAPRAAAQPSAAASAPAAAGAPSGSNAPTAATPSDLSAARGPRDLIERAALDDAREQLRRAVAQLPIAASRRVCELLAERGVPLQRIDELLAKAEPAGAPRWYSDGVCEVVLRLPHGLVAPAVRAWLSDAGATDAAGAVDAPAAALPDLIVSGTIHAVAVDGGAALLPWPRREPAAAEQAAEAARLDAQRGLLERIRLLKLGDGLIVADLLADEPRIAWDLAEELPDVRFGPAAFAPDESCLVRAEIDAGAVARRIAGLMQRREAGELVAVETVQRLAELNGGGAPSAVGIGRPHPDLLRGAESEAPAWAAACLSATGTSAGFEGAAGSNDPTASADAERRARLDAERRLALAAEQLEFAPGRALRNVILSRPDLARDLQVWLAGAVQTGPARVAADGRATVSLSLPARRLWQIVSRPATR